MTERTDQGELHQTERTWGKLPERLIHDGAISDGAKVLYAHMHWRFGKNGQNFEGVRSIAEMLDKDERTIQRLIRELEWENWIIVEVRKRDNGSQTTNFYHVFEGQQEAYDYRLLVARDKSLPRIRKPRESEAKKRQREKMAAELKAFLDAHKDDPRDDYDTGLDDGVTKLSPTPGDKNVTPPVTETSPPYLDSEYLDSEKEEPRDSADASGAAQSEPKSAEKISGKKAVPDEASVKPKTPHQLMYDAILAAFGWNGSLNNNERGQINKASKLLRESQVSPKDIDSLHRWCKKQKWASTFGPIAMANHVQEWAKQTGVNLNAEGTEGPHPPDGTIAGPGQRWYRGRITSAWTPDEGEDDDALPDV